MTVDATAHGGGSTTGRPDPPLLQISNLVVRFKSASGAVRAVNGISLSVERGEAVGLAGESGCGKTVTALSILRLLPSPPAEIVAGEIRFNGIDLLSLSEPDIRAIRGNRIAMVFQDPMSSLNGLMPIGAQVVESLTLHGVVRGRAARTRAKELLSSVGIPDPERAFNAYPHEFSGGMRQRVMIAMALSCDPALLIADEPTTALDVTVQAQIIELISKLREELGMAVLLITHDLGVMAGVVDRLNIMYAGYVVESGPVDQIYNSPGHPYTRGLLNSIPRIEGAKDRRLDAIPGTPPTLSDADTGCPFRPRCAFSPERARQEMPPLVPYGANGPEHHVACWLDLSTDPPAVREI